MSAIHAMTFLSRISELSGLKSAAILRHHLFKNRWAKSLLAASLLALVALTGCGGGGGGSAPRAGAPAGGSTARVKGQVAVGVEFPARPASRAAQGRTGAKLAANAVRVQVALHAFEDGEEAAAATVQESLDRPAGGGRVSKTFVVPVGRYLLRLAAQDSEGNTVGVSVEAVKVEAQKTSTVPATLGLLHDEKGFSPREMTLLTGERLSVQQLGLAQGLFSLTPQEGLSRSAATAAVGGCQATLHRTGALACTLRQPGVYTLRSPEGHTATITVAQDAAALAAAKPSLGIERAEGLALSGSAFTAVFTVNNGGEALPQGLKLDPGNGAAPVSVSDNEVRVSYTQGGYLARLLSATGEVLGQRSVVVFEPDLQAPPAVALGATPTAVSVSALVLSGTAAPGSTVVVAVAPSGAAVQTQADEAGVFEVTVTLAQGQNTLAVFAVNAEGTPGPALTAQVAYAPPPVQPGALASIAVQGVGEVLVAGETVSFIVLGFDEDGNPVAFTPTVSMEGVTASFSGNTSFTPLTTGAATLLVSGPGGVTATVPLTVAPGPAAVLAITPGNVTMRVGQTTAFTVTARDAFGNAIPDVAVNWTTDGPAGLDPVTGVFTPTASGYGVVRATVAPGAGRSGSNGGDVSAVACVSVNPSSTMTRTASR